MKCDMMSKSEMQNGAQYHLWLTYISRPGFLTFFEITVYENPVWESLSIEDIEQHN